MQPDWRALEHSAITSEQAGAQTSSSTNEGLQALQLQKLFMSET